MSFPGFPVIPPDILGYFPWYVIGGIVTVVVVVWLVQAIVGLVKALSGWRKDENVAQAALRAERTRELSEAISQAREARAGEARWHGQYLAIADENERMKAKLAELGAKKDSLAAENAQNAYRLRLHRAFMASPAVSEQSKDAWEAFLGAERDAEAAEEPSPPGINGRSMP